MTPPAGRSARLYYIDPIQRSFDATVVSCERAADRIEVVLDQTAFYPTSGGQPFDTGSLDGQAVLDVVEREDGSIAHVVQAEMAPGARVTGTIDWPRRFDHMQQHTGQHLLSAAFDRMLGVRTVSFHMGVATSTIDLAREVAAAEIERAEEEANRVIWEDVPVTIRFVSAEEAAALALRKPSARSGELRLVEIADVDLSACGGTHVPRTGMVGVVAVAGWERVKGGSRIAFFCGGRARRAHGRLRAVTAAAARSLSVPVDELPGAIERHQAEARDAARTREHLEEELDSWRAEGLRRTDAETIRGLRVVLTIRQDKDPAALKRLAAAVVSVPGIIAILVGRGQPAPVVVARSRDVSFDAGAWMKRAAERLGGRGGGRSEQAQGGLVAAPEAILMYARETLESASSESGVNGTGPQQYG
jgi:alanyl-tRNA synthetase